MCSPHLRKSKLWWDHLIEPSTHYHVYVLCESFTQLQARGTPPSPRSPLSASVLSRVCLTCSRPVQRVSTGRRVADHEARGCGARRRLRIRRRCVCGSGCMASSRTRPMSRSDAPRHRPYHGASFATATASVPTVRVAAPAARLGFSSHGRHAAHAHTLSPQCLRARSPPDDSTPQ